MHLVEVIKFLSSPHNGNFLGILELISKFDHLSRYGNKNKGNPSYLSSTICDELILIMGKKILSSVCRNIQSGKYYSLCLDSTPDTSRTDELPITIRYVSSSGESVDRFLVYLPISNHTGEYMCDKVLDKLKEQDIDIQNCHGQSYDNAVNMSGKYAGLQRKIKDVNNLVDYIPCAIPFIEPRRSTWCWLLFGGNTFLRFAQQTLCILIRVNTSLGILTKGPIQMKITGDGLVMLRQQKHCA